MLLPDLPLFLGDTQYSQFTHVPLPVLFSQLGNIYSTRICGYFVLYYEAFFIHVNSSGIYVLIINLHVKIQALYLQTMNLGKRVYENMQVFIHYYRQSFVYYHNPASNRADAREISFLSASVFIFCVRRSFLTTLMFTQI